MKKENLLYLIVVLLIFLSGCINTQKKDKESIISHLEEELAIESKIIDYDPSDFTTIERLDVINEIIESETVGSYVLKPRLGYCSNVLKINNENTALTFVLGYYPQNEELDMWYSYKEDNSSISSSDFKKKDGLFEVHVFPKDVKYDTMSVFGYFNNTSYGTMFCYEVK